MFPEIIITIKTRITSASNIFCFLLNYVFITLLSFCPRIAIKLTPARPSGKFTISRYANPSMNLPIYACYLVGHRMRAVVFNAGGSAKDLTSGMK